MSASLVGSEMCIRDRVFGAKVANPAQRARILVGNPGQRIERATSEPVSYTHLTLPTICSV
eukprot:10183-Alexandrium_andersonii.AAC.1